MFIWANAHVLAVQTQNLVKILKSLADLNRLRIITAIGKGSLSVSEIIHATELPQTLVSFHLKTLRNAGIVKTQRNGPFIFYSLFSANIIDVLNDLSRTNDAVAASAESRLNKDSNGQLKTGWGGPHGQK